MDNIRCKDKALEDQRWTPVLRRFARWSLLISSLDWLQTQKLYHISDQSSVAVLRGNEKQLCTMRLCRLYVEWKECRIKWKLNFKIANLIHFNLISFNWLLLSCWRLLFFASFYRIALCLFRPMVHQCSCLNVSGFIIDSICCSKFQQNQRLSFHFSLLNVALRTFNAKLL